MSLLQNGIKVCTKGIVVGLPREDVSPTVDSQLSRMDSLLARELDTWSPKSDFTNVSECETNPHEIFAVYLMPSLVAMV